MIQNLRNEIHKFPVIDIHSHVSYKNPQAGNINQILFYPYILSELKSAGVKYNKTESFSIDEIINILPYFRYIRNTTAYFILKIMVRDLYGFELDTLTVKNLHKFCRKIEEKSKDKNHLEEIFRKSNIEKVALYIDINQAIKENINYNKKFFWFSIMINNNVIPDKNYFYNLEKSTNISIDSFEKLMSAYLKIIKELVKLGTKSFTIYYNRKLFLGKISNSIKRKIVLIFKKIKNGDTLSEHDMYIFNGVLTRVITEVCGYYKLPVQVAIGVRSTKIGIYVPMFRDEMIFELSELFGDFPDTKFELILANEIQLHEISIFTKLYQNVWVGPFWWFNVYPSIMRHGIRERLEIVPYNKIHLSLSDAYCMEWCYAKLWNIKEQMSSVLSNMVEEGIYSEKFALEIAKYLIYDGPKQFYKIV